MSDTRFCYVILAHTDPTGLRRLVARIRSLSPQAAIVVRHEDPQLIGPGELDPLGAIDLVSDIRVRWGSFAMVQAMLEAFGVALSQTDAEHVVLVSGQDYPVRDLAAWEAEIADAGVDLLIDPMPAEERTYARHFTTFSLPGRRSVPKRAVHWAMDRVGRVSERWVSLYRLERTGDDVWWLSVPRRGGSERPDWLVKASQWMTIRRDVLTQVLEVAGPSGKGLGPVRTMLVPDEIAVQSTAARLATALREGPTSATWFPPDSPSPAWLTPELVRELATGGAPFARKLSPTDWVGPVEAADALVAQASAGPTVPTTPDGTGVTRPAGARPKHGVLKPGQ